MKQRGTKRPFRFQQFEVRDQGAAMKVGTDGVLLGSWAPVRGAKRTIDIGTGSGLIALMIGQRTVALKSVVHAIDVDSAAATQALENFSNSPCSERLPNRLSEIHLSLQELTAGLDRESPYDLAVCNPPFFSNSYLPDSAPRQRARHSDQLPRRSLFVDAHSILSATGRLCLVLPYEQAIETIQIAAEEGFGLLSRTDVRPNPTAELKRVLLEFTKRREGRHRNGSEIVHTELIVESKRHEFTAEYRTLTQDFHLRFADDKN